MHPYLVERVGAEHRNDLMREADRWRLAHFNRPEAQRWARWWWLLRRAGAVARWLLSPVPGPWCRTVPNRRSLVSEPAISSGSRALRLETVAASEVPESESAAWLIDLDRVTGEREQTTSSK